MIGTADKIMLLGVAEHVDRHPASMWFVLGLLAALDGGPWVEGLAFHVMSGFRTSESPQEVN